MCVSGAIYLGRAAVGDTTRIEFTITKDGSPWDLTTAAVQLTLLGPGRSPNHQVPMTISDPTAGVAYYDTLTTDLSAPGPWRLGVKVTDGAVVETYPYDITLTVTAEP